MLTPRQSFQCIHQTSLANFTFANEDEFGFVKNDMIGGFGAQVGLDCIETFFESCIELGVKRIIAEFEVFPDAQVELWGKVNV